MLIYSTDIGHIYTCTCLHVAVGVYTYVLYIIIPSDIYKRKNVHVHIYYTYNDTGILYKCAIKPALKIHWYSTLPTGLI